MFLDIYVVRIINIIKCLLEHRRFDDPYHFLSYFGGVHRIKKWNSIGHALEHLENSEPKIMISRPTLCASYVWEGKEPLKVNVVVYYLRKKFKACLKSVEASICLSSMKVCLCFPP